jgi:DNA-binding MarR family transcriptional regulator
MPPDKGSRTGPTVDHDPVVDYPNRELMQVAVEFSSELQRWMASVGHDGLTYPRMRVLEELHCHGPAKLRALADLLGLSPRNLTALADGLESEGLAKRVDHPTDRRITLLELTPEGIAAADEALAPRLAALGEFFNRLPAAERSQLETLLRTLVAAIHESCDDAPADPRRS